MKLTTLILTLAIAMTGCMKSRSGEILEPVAPIEISSNDQLPVTYDQSGSLKLIRPEETVEKLPPVTYTGLTN